jgi:8-oxo-dGTP diphosphatase
MYILGAKEQGAGETNGRWLVIPRTLCFVMNDGDVLLMKRAANRRVFPNRYNGLGGHIERDEEPMSSVKREVEEETGLEIYDVRLRGIYNIDTGETAGIMLLIFTAETDEREIKVESEEGTLHWTPLATAASLDLVEDLPYILPLIANMGDNSLPFFVHVSYDENDVIQMRFEDEDMLPE